MAAQPAKAEAKRKPRERNRKLLTDLMIERIRPPKEAQEMHWDTVQHGLGLLVGAGGAKSFRSHFNLNGRWLSRTLGRFGEIATGDDDAADVNVRWAREQVRKDRRDAAQGIDPRERAKAEAPKVGLTFKDVLADYIELCAKPRQKHWQETQRVLTKNCAAWMDKRIDRISRADAKTLLRGFIKEGHGAKAGNTHAWLRAMFGWAVEEEIVSDNIMLFSLPYEKKVRDRVYSDDEIKSIWNAADQLAAVERANVKGREPTKAEKLRIDQAVIEGSYVKLLLLIAPRRNELAGMRWSELDDIEKPTLWTTPPTRTKTRKSAKPRSYLTPLCPLAVRIIKSLPKGDDEFVFFGRTKGKPIVPGSPLKRKLAKLGAPADIGFHAMRHTLASWFEEYSDFEVALLLNHSGGSNVTAGYRHSYALDLKRRLLTEWADHVGTLIQPSAGVALLR